MSLLLQQVSIPHLALQVRHWWLLSTNMHTFVGVEVAPLHVYCHWVEATQLLSALNEGHYCH